jgi:hypothetical protein
MDMAGVLTVVERQEIEVARGIRWCGPEGSVQTGVRDDAAGWDERRADDGNPRLASSLFARRPNPWRKTRGETNAVDRRPAGDERSTAVQSGALPRIHAAAG